MYVHISDMLFDQKSPVHQEEGFPRVDSYTGSVKYLPLMNQTLPMQNTGALHNIAMNYTCSLV